MSRLATIRTLVQLEQLSFDAAQALFIASRMQTGCSKQLEHHQHLGVSPLRDESTRCTFRSCVLRCENGAPWHVG